MTILEINDIEGYGGAEFVVASLVELFRRKGHDVVPFYGKRTLKTPITRVYNMEARKRMERVLDGNDVELAHIHNFHWTLGPSILAPLKERGIRTIATLHDYQLICPSIEMDCEGEERSCLRCRLMKRKWRALFDGMQELYRDRMLDHVEAFICPSRFLMERFRENEMFRDRLVHIPNGVFPDRYEASVPEEVKVFYYGGKLARSKGLEDLLAAFKRVRGEHDVRLVISGGGGDMEDGIRELQMEGLEFVGKRPADELPLLWKRVDVAVLPSIWPENASIFLLEMMASGKPVICSDPGGNPEIVVDGGTGTVYPVGSVDGLANAMTGLVEDPERASSMGRAGRARIEERYDLEAVYDRYVPFVQ